MNMFSRRGQGTTEYLIILAIVIVIALVVVGVLGGFGSQGSAINASQSKSYWGSVQPLAVTDWKITQTGTGSQIVFKNLTANAITVSDLNWNNSNIDITDTVVSAGSSVAITSTSMTCNSTTGQPFSRTFGYTYTTADLNGLKVFGTTALVGTCQ
jgi:uncharacterized protein (UPF0333 family)